MIKPTSIVHPYLQQARAENLGDFSLRGPENEIDDILVHVEQLSELPRGMEMSTYVLGEVHDIV